MGDVAVGARSGHDGEEHRGEPEGGRVTDEQSGTDDGRGTGGPDGADGSGGSGGRGGAGGQGAADARDEDETPPRTPPAARNQRSFLRELPILIGIALVLALLIKTFLVQAFSIPSASMQNTLTEGDRVLVDKLTPWFGSQPERGEVVVFHDPDNWLADQPTPDPNALQTVLSWIGLMPSADEKDLIKRVIGVGGDTVGCKGTGPLTVNGVALNEPYVFAGNTPCSDDEGGQFEAKVPKGYIWVMGDHRQNSRDSRYNRTDKHGGMVPVDEVVGRAVVVAWPLNRWSTLPVPDTFDQSGVKKQSQAAATLTVAPQGLVLAGLIPIAWWRRKRAVPERTR